LNATALAVFRQLDGKRSAADVARALSRELGTEVGEAVVWLAVDQLAGAELLSGPVEPSVDLDRRQFTRRVAKLAIALPVLTSILVPRPSYAASAPCIDAQVCTPGSHACCGTPGQPAMACNGQGGCNSNASQCQGIVCKP
jgi:hypothetical protein